MGSVFYVSEDEGATWNKSAREVPSLKAPVRKEVVTSSDLPDISEDAGIMWTVMNISESGLGITLAYDSVKAKNLVFVTSDSGTTWNERKFSVKSLGDYLKSRLFWPEWPLRELIYDVTIVNEIILVPFQYITVEDRDYPHTHILFTGDQGLSWGYRRIGGDCGRCSLAISGQGHVISPRAGYYMESRDGGDSWQKRCFDIRRPSDYQGDVGKIQDKILDGVVFANSRKGYAQVIHHNEKKVEILKTMDEGETWEHLTDFQNVEGHIYGQHHFNLEIRQVSSFR